jgi:hypothetical protein
MIVFDVTIVGEAVGESAPWSSCSGENGTASEQVV